MQPGQAKCGAKTRKTGKPCADIAMANGRCKRHGGKSTGPKNPAVVLAEANPAYTHGLYTKFFKEDEKVLIDAGAVKLGNVEDELNVMRIRLKRALEARELWEAERAGTVDGSDDETSMALVEVVDGEAPGPEGSTIPIFKKTKRLPDFDKIVDTTIARIESLEKTRKTLLEDGPPDPDADPSDRGRDRVAFTGGLDGTDGPLPSPFEAPRK